MGVAALRAVQRFQLAVQQELNTSMPLISTATVTLMRYPPRKSMASSPGTKTLTDRGHLEPET